MTDKINNLGFNLDAIKRLFKEKPMNEKDKFIDWTTTPPLAVQTQDPASYRFILDDQEILRFESGGDAYVRGEKVDSNRSIYETVVEFFKCVVAANTKTNALADTSKPSELEYLRHQNDQLLQCNEIQKLLIADLRKRSKSFSQNSPSKTVPRDTVENPSVESMILANVLANPSLVEFVEGHRVITKDGEVVTIDDRNQLTDLLDKADGFHSTRLSATAHCEILWSNHPGYWMIEPKSGWTRYGRCGICKADLTGLPSLKAVRDYHSQ